jgi:hypothetical protein
LALDGRYRLEHLTALRLHFDLWQQYQRTIAQLDAEIAAHLKTMRRDSPLPPLPPKPRVRGRRPHDPGFDVRMALYYASGVDRTAIEGIDEVHALTLVSELGSDFTKWPTVKHFTSWLGLCPNFKQTGGQGSSWDGVCWLGSAWEQEQDGETRDVEAEKVPTPSLDPPHPFQVFIHVHVEARHVDHYPNHLDEKDPEANSTHRDTSGRETNKYPTHRTFPRSPPPNDGDNPVAAKKL